MTVQATSLNTILVIIPALDEAANIGAVVQELQTAGLSCIRVVDNGSRDRTPQIAAEAGAEVVHEPIKGYGQACWRGLQNIEPTIEWILFCDADGSDDLSQLPDLLSHRPNYDFILGNRRGTTAGRENLTPIQNFGNWLASTLIDWGWGYRYHDLGPLRLIRQQALEKIEMRDRSFGWTVEMQARAVECDLRICEIPVNYRPRQGGQSKISGTLSGSFKAGTIILTTLATLYARTLLPSPLCTDAKSCVSPSLPPWCNQGLLLLSTFLLIFGSIRSLPYGDFLNDPTAVPRFWWGMGFMGIGFLLTWWLQSVTAMWFWGVAIATRLLFLAMFPSDDIWRYLWEGYIQTQGFSPYAQPPDADILVPLEDGMVGADESSPCVGHLSPRRAIWVSPISESKALCSVI